MNTHIVLTSVGELSIRDHLDGTFTITDMQGSKREMSFPIASRYAGPLSPVIRHFGEKTARIVLYMALVGDRDLTGGLIREHGFQAPFWAAVVDEVRDKIADIPREGRPVFVPETENRAQEEKAPGTDLWITEIYGNDFAKEARELLGDPKSSVTLFAKQRGINRNTMHGILRRLAAGKGINTWKEFFQHLRRVFGRDAFADFILAAKGRMDPAKAAKPYKVEPDKLAFWGKQWLAQEGNGRQKPAMRVKAEAKAPEGRDTLSAIEAMFGKPAAKRFLGYAVAPYKSCETITGLMKATKSELGFVRKSISAIREERGIVPDMSGNEHGETGSLLDTKTMAPHMFQALSVLGRLRTSTLGDMIMEDLPLRDIDFEHHDSNPHDIRWVRKMCDVAKIWRMKGWLVGHGNRDGWALTQKGLTEIPKTYALATAA